MEGFMVNIIATAGFSSVFLVSFLAIYYLYLKGTGEEVRDEEIREEGKCKRLGKGF